MIDADFVKLLKGGDEAAFSRLVEMHQQLVYNTALGLLQSSEDAEDTAQEVFVQAYESIGSFKGEARLSTWLYRITVTKSLDRIKYLSRKKRGGFVLSLFSKEDSMHDLPDFNHPGVKLVNKERAAVLFKAMATLPDNQRIAFTLHKVEGLSHQEIGEILNCTIASVEALMHRAKQNLRKLLTDYYKP